MNVCYICGYWGRLTDRVLGKRPDDYRHAYLYVWAVKYGTYKKPFYVITKDGNKTWINPENFSSVRRRFGNFIAQRIEEHVWDGALLVHVPSKDAVLSATAPRSLTMLNEAMAATRLGHTVCDALRWSKRLDTAHEGGERRSHEIAPYLHVTQNVSSRGVVLIDDLVTRGGSLLAAQKVLEEAGATVVGAVTCGRTMYQSDIRPFGSQRFDLIEELDDYGKRTTG